MKKCAICDSKHRENIERALLKATSEPNGTKGITLESIAEEFDVSVEDLQRHAMFHSALGESDSLVRQIHMREVDLLAEVVMEQAQMVKAVGARLRDNMSGDYEDVSFERRATKPVVDLYVGSGDSVRKGVAAIADINQLLNGPKDDGLSGLAALAQVLHGSQVGGTEPAEEDELWNGLPLVPRQWTSFEILPPD